MFLGSIGGFDLKQFSPQPNACAFAYFIASAFTRGSVIAWGYNPSDTQSAIMGGAGISPELAFVAALGRHHDAFSQAGGR